MATGLVSKSNRTALGEIGQSYNRSYIASLDYLRALAAFTIVIYHGLITFRGYTNNGPWNLERWPAFWNPLAAYFVEGHTAVALFMVLSGYVLTMGVIGRDLLYWRFMKNRALRIYPLYIFLLMFGISLHPEAFNIQSFFQAILPLANNPGSFQTEVITALFWTVSVEFQFYFIFPFLIRFIEKEGKIYITLVIVMMLVFSGISTFYSIDTNQFAYHTIFGRLSQFLLGMGAAYIPSRTWMSAKFALPLGAVAMLSLLLAYHRMGGYPVHTWWKLVWPVVEAIGWSCIILTSINSPHRMPLRFGRIIKIIANMSFSMYLIHSIVFQIFGERKLYLTPFKSVYENAFLNSFLLVPIVAVLSYMTYRLIEFPFMELRVRYVSTGPQS